MRGIAAVIIRVLESSKAVLVVDDDPDVCTTIKDLLEYGGCIVDIAENMAQALSAVRIKKYSVIIIDGFVGRDNGILIAQKLKEITDSPLVFHSGSPLPSKYNDLFHKVVHKGDIRGITREVDKVA